MHLREEAALRVLVVSRSHFRREDKAASIKGVNLLGAGGLGLPAALPTTAKYHRSNLGKEPGVRRAEHGPASQQKTASSIAAVVLDLPRRDEMNTRLRLTVDRFSDRGPHRRREKAVSIALAATRDQEL